jgi:hypothetical protein
MSDPRPSFLGPAPSFLPPGKVPDWLAGAPARDPVLPIGKELLIERFKLFFPRVLDRMYAGETLNTILKEFPLQVERGAFMRWVTKDTDRHTLFKEAKTVRTEIWTGRLIEISEGSEEVPMELDRAKLLSDNLKWLIKSENKKEYGDSKQIEMTGTISINAALQQAGTRIERLAAFVDDDVDMPTMKQLAEVVEAEYEEVDDD